MAWTSTRLAVLGAFLLASIVSVIAVGQHALSKSKAQTSEVSVAAYADQGMLFPAGHYYRDLAKVSKTVSKTSLAFEEPASMQLLGPRIANL